ncbi:MAG: hypothetical protein U9Q15_00690 [Patescibacteria group bacterium]|nr:hypothetical protein [Patescibacteria group bacterium]
MLEDTAQRTNNIERILKENKRDIEKDIIVKGENIFFSKYAVYMFLERIDKFLFPNIDIYKEIKAYFYEKDFVGW